jgi:hypothetical protein
MRLVESRKRFGSESLSCHLVLEAVRGSVEV